ncbi:hypothetical protein BDV93DRAFT_605713 [Ceratobasidium sp. AG-I]|nr:hypothetical protein BDV93DRAFT_605713 [Ceratobasidium sp. AG-I]
MEHLPKTCEDLPPECLLRVIEFLTLADVTVLLRTSNFWHSIICQNENTIYCRLAGSQEPYNAPIGSLETTLTRWLSPAATQVKTWKQYCRFQIDTRQRWFGKDLAYHSRDVLGSAKKLQVHRLKIDVEKSLLVMTVERSPGCLVVHCLQDPTRPALFQLEGIANVAHLEMSNGFVVFTCEENHLLEVWRYAEDQAVQPLSRAPTDEQRVMYENGMKSAGYRPSSSPHRGELVPMGALRQPALLRASRLAYPTLCVGSRSGDCLWLWDIRTREITQTINLVPCPYDMFGMLYVDVNETHAFVATHTVSVYSRASGKCVFQLQDSKLEVITSCAITPTRSFQTVFEDYALRPYRDPDPINYGYSPLDIVMAVHVSPSGNDFVAITFRGYLLHISGLKELNEGRSAFSLDDLRVSVVNVDQRLDNLAYDGDRILVHGARGLSLMNLESQSRSPHRLRHRDATVKLYSFPAKVLHRVPPFGGSNDQFDGCSCVQLTRESLWIAWQSPDQEGDEPRTSRKAVGMIDFAQATPSLGEAGL